MRADRGSASAELVILAPLMLCILGVMFVAGRLLLARQAVVDAARTAAESAVVSATPEGAVAAALSNVESSLKADGVVCSPASVATDTTNFRPGGDLSVTVSCVAPISHIAYVPVHGSVRLSATSSAVVEPYRQVGP